MQIYLDYSATTPPHPAAIAAMQATLTHAWGNPSSLHQWGERSAWIIEQARAQVASLINAPADSIVFTSGGTEANNLAILGIAQQYATPQHLVISSVEHPAVSEPAQWLEQQGWAVTRLSVDSQGWINPLELKTALRANTVLVSIIYGQSEVGTLQPIAALGHIARSQNVLFHTDAVQVAGRLPIDVQSLPVDLLSLSGHKFYGPQGVGALYVRSGVDLIPHLRGGGQEGRLRSGTQATPAISGFGVAAQSAAEAMQTEIPRLVALRDRLFTHLADVPGLLPTGVWSATSDYNLRQRLPHHVSFCLHYADGDALTGRALVRQMNLAGIGMSAGSACQSGKSVPSPVLLAMGYSDRLAQGAIRLTLGRDTTVDDVDWTAIVLKQVLERLMDQVWSQRKTRQYSSC
jgi:cysteine desulfurase